MPSRREDMGSWLDGTPGGAGAGPTGSRLDLPPSGPGSMATVPRRLAALTVDWVLSMAVSLVVDPPPPGDVPPILATDPTTTLLVFVASTTVFVGLVGHTVGHRLLGIRVRRLVAADPRPPGPLLALVRTVLLALVIPPAVWDRDGRGMHDVAARTVVVRR